MWVQIHYSQDDIGQVGCRLTVEDDLFIVGGMEPQPVVELQGRILSPHSVYKCYKFPEDVGPFPVPMPNLVLFTVDIFFTTWPGNRLMVLKWRAVYSIRGPQRRC
jgi:hypothetical protein